jgi:hypothetical protein
MAKKKPVHVTPRDDGWAVMREGNERARPYTARRRKPRKRADRLPVTIRRNSYCTTSRAKLESATATARTPIPPRANNA